MCLIAFGLDAHSSYRLVLAANRDEFYHRPADPAHWWSDRPAILGGRDRQASGTWMGMTRDGRLAALTNVRDAPRSRPAARTRGTLPLDFLLSANQPDEHANQLLDGPARSASDYAGFNLLMLKVSGRSSRGSWVSNRSERAQSFHEGVYGLSNHLLDTPWPKVRRLKQALRDSLALTQAVDVEARLFSCLADDQVFPDEELPATGVPLDRERMLSPVFVKSTDYGTRTSSVILVDHQGRVSLTERSWIDPSQGARGYRERRFSFRCVPE